MKLAGCLLVLVKPKYHCFIHSLFSKGKLQFELFLVALIKYILLVTVSFTYFTFEVMH